MKEIKPGVLSKIMDLSEYCLKTPLNENLGKLVASAKNIQECLFEFANCKPGKKMLIRNNEAESNQSLKNDPKAFKELIGDILEFK